VIQVKIADIWAQLEAARLLTYRAAVMKDRGELFLLAGAQAKLPRTRNGKIDGHALADLTE
jgi:alkylation response protein AidB-like acyl-CoA dehydrogenase